MKIGKTVLCKYVAVILAISLMLSGCVVEKSTEKGHDTTQEISVAFYSLLPGAHLLKEILIEEWAKIEPDVELVIEDWDCYSGPIESDILCYDAVFLSHLAEKGYIQPIDVEDIECRDDVFPFVMDGITYRGEYYGTPYLLCSNFLFYYKDDAELAAVDNIIQLQAVAEERRKEDKTTGVVSLFDIDDAYAYLDAWVDSLGEYTTFEDLPDGTNLDKELLSPIQEVNSMSVEFSEEILQDKGKPELFGEGHGFAYIGMSEHLSDMSNIQDELDIKTIANTDAENIPLFYTDLASIGSQVTDSEKLENCKKLINLFSSSTVLKRFLLEQEECWFTMPARKDVFSLAAEGEPLYERLYEIAQNEDNRIFRTGVDIYDFLKIYEDSKVQE